jgi:hypothetical protein
MIKRGLKIRYLLICVGAYLLLFLFIRGAGLEATWPLTYVFAAVLTAWICYAQDGTSDAGDSIDFRRTDPMGRFGAAVVDFDHVFSHRLSLSVPIVDRIEGGLAKAGVFTDSKLRTLRDRDRALTEPDLREFRFYSGLVTARGTRITFALRQDQHGQGQGVRWWILVRGYDDPNKVLLYLATAPLTVPFWIVSYIRGEHRVRDTLVTTYSAFYNDLDLLFALRTAHGLALDALVDVLEEHGVDVSDLKARRAQALTINVRGGKTRFGNVIQGAFNTVREQAPAPKVG